MKKSDSSRLNGLKGGMIIRQKALERYYLSPNHCLWCGKMIEVKEGQKVTDVKVKKFCDRSCAAKYNNQGVTRHGTPGGKKRPPKEQPIVFHTHTECDRCGQIIKLKKQKKGYCNRKYCDICYPLMRKEITRNQHIKNGTALPKPVEDMTKQELFSLRGDQRARIRITKNARVSY